MFQTTEIKTKQNQIKILDPLTCTI